MLEGHTFVTRNLVKFFISPTRRTKDNNGASQRLVGDSRMNPTKRMGLFIFITKGPGICSAPLPKLKSLKTYAENQTTCLGQDLESRENEVFGSSAPGAMSWTTDDPQILLGQKWSPGPDLLSGL
jgi:hypothetical protein